tara:strand:+ start:273 stop:488 length:216 start_codon:yes stop_codon:yes gene_type:complete
MLTPRQLKLFLYLKEYKKENKKMPLFTEILKYMNMKSLQNAYQMLEYLEFKGFIKRKKHITRGIEIIKEVA